MFLFETFEWIDVVILGECLSITGLELQHRYTSYLFFVLARNYTTFVWLSCYFGVFLSSCIDTYLLAFLEILSEIQMAGLQSYLKGRLQMGIWSVCTMAGNLMVLVLASESHRSNLHSECKHEIPTYNLFVSTHVGSMFWGMSLSYLSVLKTTGVSADFDALVAQFSFLKGYAASHSWVNFAVLRQLSCWWEWLTKCVWIMVLVAVGTWCKKIQKAASTWPYEVQESQAVIWVCLSEKMPGDPKKFPWFEHYAREGFQHNSRIQELPYDHSVVLENLMDPAHVPISHDLTDFSAKSEDASALVSLKSFWLIFVDWLPQRALLLGNRDHSKLQFPFSCGCKSNKAFLQQWGSVDSEFAPVQLKP